MNSIELAVFTQLSADAGVAAIVGGSGTSPASTPKIYPLKVPQSAGSDLPALTYFIVTDTAEVVHGGLAGQGDARIQISAWSKSITTAKTLMEAVRLALALGTRQTWNGVAVSPFGFAVGPDLYEEDTKIYQIPCHVSLWHGESTA